MLGALVAAAAGGRWVERKPERAGGSATQGLRQSVIDGDGERWMGSEQRLS